jgi:hypothetical protein
LIIRYIKRRKISYHLYPNIIVKILQEARNVRNIARQDEPLPPSSQLILVSQELKRYLDVEA